LIQEIPGVKWQSLFVMVILVAVILAAACTDEERPAPPPEPQGVILPGQVLYTIGDVTGEGTLGGTLNSGTIDTITLTVGLVPGQKPIFFDNISIFYADALRTESLTPVEGLRGDPPQGCWGVLAVQKEIGIPNERLEYEEQLVIRINPKSPLVPRQLVTISIKTPSGTPLTIRRVSPPTILKENNILAPV
jgi:hypothetical protein